MPESTDEGPKIGADNSRLPSEAIHLLTLPLKRFLRIEAAAGVVLLLAVLVALTASNSTIAHSFFEFWEIPFGIQIGSFESVRSLREWITDALMTLFFLLVALELKRAIVLGELRNPRMASLSILAAFGGMLVPALLYLMLMYGEAGQSGWGTVMATDTAFVIGSLALLGSYIPQSLRLFMLTLAIVDDIGAILIVAIGYGDDLRWDALAWAVFGILIVRLIALLGVRSIPIYFLLGFFIWSAVDVSGIHATVTGVILGLMAPTEAWVSSERLHAILGRVLTYSKGEHGGDDAAHRKELQSAETASREIHSPIEQLELKLHPWVGFVILPLFALANAGVPISLIDLGSSTTIAVFIGLVIGKPIGIVLFSWLAVRAGLAMLPPNLNWILVTGGGLLAGIGFTMALFIADLAFPVDSINKAKLGILLASIVSAFAGIALLGAYSALKKNS
jgi:NhaA family Na+:H+ antiporter